MITQDLYITLALLFALIVMLLLRTNRLRSKCKKLENRIFYLELKHLSLQETFELHQQLNIDYMSKKIDSLQKRL